MVTSIDGKVTGEFLSRQECEKATDIYYELNREYNKNGASGFICGRVTMESSFTVGWYPDLSGYEPVEDKNDFIAIASYDSKFTIKTEDLADFLPEAGESVTLWLNIFCCSPTKCMPANPFSCANDCHKSMNCCVLGMSRGLQIKNNGLPSTVI